MKILKLINNDILIGTATKGDNEQVVIEKPYTVKDLGNGPCVLPYELDMLMEPMEFVAFNPYNILWLKNLSDFPEVQNQYTAATSGIELS